MCSTCPKALGRSPESWAQRLRRWHPSWWGNLLAPHGIALLAAAYCAVGPLPSMCCEIPLETVADAANAAQTFLLEIDVSSRDFSDLRYWQLRMIASALGGDVDSRITTS